MKAKQLIFVALIIVLPQCSWAQSPCEDCDTIQQMPGVYMYNLPATGIYHDDTVYCQAAINALAAGVETWEDVNSLDEYAVRMYTEDSLRIYGVALMVQYVDTVILTLYDSVMTPLASLRSLSLYWTMSDIQWMMAQPQYHCYNLPGYPYSADELYVGELLGGCASRLLWFNYFNPKDYPYVAVKGTFYVGYRNTDIGIRKHEILCIEENHEPPYAFTHDYRRKMSGVWEDEDHHIARWIPMLFPITLPEDEQPGGGNPENPDPDNPNPDNPPEGISEVAGAVGFTLRPNPAREEVTLEGGAWMSGGVLTVTDMRGTEVVRRKVESGRLTLDVSRLPKGAYTVSVTTSEGTVARRLVVQ